MERGKGFNPACATRALELLGKHLGTFEPKIKDLEQRPAFVGINIHMGDKPRLEIIRDKANLPQSTTPAINIKEKLKKTMLN